MAAMTIHNDGKITWTDGKKYNLDFSFLQKIVGMDPVELGQMAKERKPWKDVLLAYMAANPTTGGDAATTPGHTRLTQAQIDALPPADQIAYYRAENQRLAAAKAGQAKITLKVSDKGALSVYGMGRFPVTLYREQWEKLLAMSGEIQAFIAAHPELKVKE